MLKRRQLVLGGAGFGLSACLAWPTAAQTLIAPFAFSGDAPYPAGRPLRIVVPFPAGGTTDLRARQVAEKLRVDSGWSVVVDNRPGASGMIGADLVAKAAPDGNTVLLGTIGVLAINPHLLPAQPYNVLRDFQAVTQFSRSVSLLCAHKSSGIRSLADLQNQAAAQASSGAKLAYASTGNATIGHMVMESYKRRAGLMSTREVTHVPYRGSAPALQDFLSGQVALHIDTPSATWEHLSTRNPNGVAVPIAVTSAQRMPQIAQVPTFVEQGLPGLVFDTWQGIVAPRGVPSPVIEVLHREITRALRQPDVVRSHEEQVNTVVASTPAEFERYIAQESARWAQVVADTGIKPDAA